MLPWRHFDTSSLCLLIEYIYMYIYNNLVFKFQHMGMTKEMDEVFMWRKLKQAVELFMWNI